MFKQLSFFAILAISTVSAASGDYNRECCCYINYMCVRFNTHPVCTYFLQPPTCPPRLTLLMVNMVTMTVLADMEPLVKHPNVKTSLSIASRISVFGLLTQNPKLLVHRKLMKLLGAWSLDTVPVLFPTTPFTVLTFSRHLLMFKSLVTVNWPILISRTRMKVVNWTLTVLPVLVTQSEVSSLPEPLLVHSNKFTNGKTLWTTIPFASVDALEHMPRNGALTFTMSWDVRGTNLPTMPIMCLNNVMVQKALGPVFTVEVPGTKESSQHHLLNQPEAVVIAEHMRPSPLVQLPSFLPSEECKLPSPVPLNGATTTKYNTSFHSTTKAPSWTSFKFCLLLFIFSFFFSHTLTQLIIHNSEPSPLRVVITKAKSHPL